MPESVSAIEAAAVLPVEPDPLAVPLHDRRKVRLWGWTVTLVLLGAYLLLQNPYWVPGGDSDFYVSIARTLALEGKYTYNGLPVAISPPGWPWVLAMVMKVSPTFLAMKLVTMTCMLTSLVIGYFIALRFVKPSAAGVSILLAGLLMPVYSLTYFLHSEGLYCLLAAWALLISLRVRESRALLIEKLVLVLLCIALPMIRWAGVFQVLPIAAVLMSGRGWRDAWRRGPRAWIRYVAIRRNGILALLCLLAIVATWQATRKSLELTAEQLESLRRNGGTSTMDPEQEEPPTEVAPVPTMPQGKSGKVTVLEEYTQRFLRAGKWFSWLLWQPARFASVSKLTDNLVTVAGWVVILMLGALAALAVVQRREWLWVSLALYCGGLCMNWPNPNSRYFVPVAPLIILGLFVLLYEAARRYPAKSFDGWKWLRRALVYSILLCNLTMYGVDVIVMRSSRFYETFEAGQHKDLVNIAHYLVNLPPLVEGDAATQPARRAINPSSLPSPTTSQSTPVLALRRPTDGRIMINERYDNLGRVRFSKAGMRAMVLLTDIDIKPLDPGLSKNVAPLDPTTTGNGKPWPGSLLRFVKGRGTRFLLMQEPAIPWRVWHFRLPMDWHNQLTKTPGLPPSGGWKVYYYDWQTNNLYELPVPNVDNWPTRVPGM